jgi:hypothetical protein
VWRRKGREKTTKLARTMKRRGYDRDCALCNERRAACRWREGNEGRERNGEEEEEEEEEEEG